MKMVFSNFSPKTPKLGIFGPKLKDFFSAPNFAIRQIRGCWLQKGQWFFKIAPKHPNKAFLVPNLRILIFARNFAITQIGGRWSQIWQ